MHRPLIGVTADPAADRYSASRSLVDMVAYAGGLPFILPCLAERAAEFVRVCGGLVLSGGDDPVMEGFGAPTHPQARPIDPRRQAFELALLDALAAGPQRPVLGVCLGMQLMGLHAGGALDQYLPESLPTASVHWGKVEHRVGGELAEGMVHSHHRQALTDPGSLRVIATAPDGVVEAVRDDDQPFYLGVQWHPERTADERLGLDLVRALIEHASASLVTA